LWLLLILTILDPYQGRISPGIVEYLPNKLMFPTDIENIGLIERENMAKQITVEMTVFEVLDQVPGAIELFRAHGVNPTAACGPLMRQIRLIDTPDRCDLADLYLLVEKLNGALLEGTEKHG
jgi:hypothetical protein